MAQEPVTGVPGSPRLQASSTVGHHKATHEGPVTALVVDDEIDVRTLIRFVLEAQDRGITVVAEAADGLEGLAVFDQLHPPPVPTIVILDSRMPGLTGLELAREIRARLPRQRIVLFTAFLNDELKAQADEIGIDACLSKYDYMQLPGLVIELTDSGRD